MQKVKIQETPKRHLAEQMVPLCQQILHTLLFCQLLFLQTLIHLFFLQTLIYFRLQTLILFFFFQTLIQLSLQGGRDSGNPKLYGKSWWQLFLALTTRLLWPKVTFLFLNIPISPKKYHFFSASLTNICDMSAIYWDLGNA